MKSLTSFSRIRSAARQNLAGNYMTFFLAIVVAVGLSFAIDSILSWAAAPLLAGQSLFNLIASLMVTCLVYSFITVLQAGILYVSLNIARRSEASVGDVLLGFRYHPETAIAISLLTALLRTVCTLPLYLVMDRIYAVGIYSAAGAGKAMSPAAAVPAFLAALAAAVVLDFLILYSYSQALFLYIDHQDYSALRCLKESRLLMKGRRIRYLMLNLSFLGYAALSVLSLGLGCVWTIPYYNVSCAEFYMDLSGNYSGF